MRSLLMATISVRSRLFTWGWILLLIGGLGPSSVKSAHADWEGTMKSSGTRGGDMPGGKVYLKRGKMRFDTTHGRMGPASVIVDAKSKEMLNLLHRPKLVMKMSFNALNNASSGEAKHLMPVCDPEQGATRCLQSQGFKKTGSERANGFECEIFEKKAEGRVTRVWHPRNQEEIPSVRMVMLNGETKDAQEEIRIDITDLQKKDLGADLFQPPSDYQTQDMSAFSQLLMRQKGAGSAAGSGSAPSAAEMRDAVQSLEGLKELMRSRRKKARESTK
jgi:hypothetical protein